MRKTSFFNLKIRTSTENSSCYKCKGYNVGCFYRSFFSLKILIFGLFIVAMSDLVHDVEAIFALSQLLTAS